MFTVVALCIQLALTGAVMEPNISPNAKPEAKIETKIETNMQNEMEQDTEETLLEAISFLEIQNILEHILREDEVGFQELVVQLINGERSISEITGEEISKCLTEGFAIDKQEFSYLFLLAVSASVFSVFADALKDRQISDTWFYIIYMMAGVLVFRAFWEVMDYSVWSAESLSSFMQALIPAYALSVTMAVGPCSGAGFYQCTLILISLLSTVIQHLVLPMIKAYVVLKILNHISEEDVLSKLTGLFAGGVKWLMKTTMATLVGFQVIQSMLAPAIDSLKNKSINKTIAAIPGIGSAAGAVTELLLGSAVLVKNGIGTAAIIVVLLICIPPLLKMALFTVSYTVIAAVIQPVADKRFTGCISAAAEGGCLLFQSTAMMAGMFMISIALVALRG